MCKYGEMSDVGSEFEMRLLVLDERASGRVERWVRRARETGAAPPITLPSHVPGCLPVLVSVRKTDHADLS
jgi:hypothetical protein